MYDPMDDRPRYLVHYSDGGSGMLRVDAPIEVGGELRDGGSRYRVMKVEHPPNPRAFGHVWADLQASGACTRVSKP